MDNLKSGLWRNKKKGDIYSVIGVVRNCTNAQDGQQMVEYHSEKAGKCVRELTEFMQKFEPVMEEYPMEKH